jgi:hypothetical protein
MGVPPSREISAAALLMAMTRREVAVRGGYVEAVRELERGNDDEAAADAVGSMRAGREGVTRAG